MATQRGQEIAGPENDLKEKAKRIQQSQTILQIVRLFCCCFCWGRGEIQNKRMMIDYRIWGYLIFGFVQLKHPQKQETTCKKITYVSCEATKDPRSVWGFPLVTWSLEIRDHSFPELDDG